MRERDLITALGMSGEDALRVLYFARQHNLTVDVASNAIWAAREMIEYEITPSGVPHEYIHDFEDVVPYSAYGLALLAAYMRPDLVDKMRNAAKQGNKPLADLVEEAVLNLLDKLYDAAPEVVESIDQPG
jgi:hypothetical protein